MRGDLRSICRLGKVTCMTDKQSHIHVVAQVLVQLKPQFEAGINIHTHYRTPRVPCFVFLLFCRLYKFPDSS